MGAFVHSAQQLVSFPVTTLKPTHHPGSYLHRAGRKLGLGGGGLLSPFSDPPPWRGL